MNTDKLSAEFSSFIQPSENEKGEPTSNVEKQTVETQTGFGESFSKMFTVVENLFLHVDEETARTTKTNNPRLETRNFANKQYNALLVDILPNIGSEISNLNETNIKTLKKLLNTFSHISKQTLSNTDVSWHQEKVIELLTPILETAIFVMEGQEKLDFENATQEEKDLIKILRTANIENDGTGLEKKVKDYAILKSINQADSSIQIARKEYIRKLAEKLNLWPVRKLYREVI